VPLGFLFGALALWLANPTPRTLAAGAAIAAAGEALRVWAAGHLDKGREVTRSGPYRFTPHPLYLGSTIMGAGLAVASASLGVALIVAAYLTLTLTAAIRAEEAWLGRRFGAAYDDYRAGRGAAAPRRFSLARAIANREYRAVAGLAAVLAILAWKAWRGR
jgi:protein-S-isoprenylcysteine O-methyltransferase Ste14